MDELIAKWKTSGKEAVEYLEEHSSKLAPEAFQSNKDDYGGSKRRRLGQMSDAWQAVYDAHDRIIQQEKEDDEDENVQEDEETANQAPVEDKPANPMEEWLSKVKAILD